MSGEPHSEQKRWLGRSTARQAGQRSVNRTPQWRQKLAPGGHSPLQAGHAKTSLASIENDTTPSEDMRRYGERQSALTVSYGHSSMNARGRPGGETPSVAEDNIIAL